MLLVMIRQYPTMRVFMDEVGVTVMPQSLIGKMIPKMNVCKEYKSITSAILEMG